LRDAHRLCGGELRQDEKKKEEQTFHEPR
jgi:hypothetical protein